MADGQKCVCPTAIEHFYCSLALFPATVPRWQTPYTAALVHHTGRLTPWKLLYVTHWDSVYYLPSPESVENMLGMQMEPLTVSRLELHLYRIKKGELF